MQSTLATVLLLVLFGLIGYHQRSVLSVGVRGRIRDMGLYYSWGMFSAGLNGAAMAVKATLGVAAGAALNPQAIQAPNPEMALSIFLAAFALNALDWFTKNPLPTSLIETTTTTETTTETETRTDTVAKPPIQP